MRSGAASRGRRPYTSDVPLVYLSCTSDVPASVAAVSGWKSGAAGTLALPVPDSSGRDRLPSPHLLVVGEPDGELRFRVRLGVERLGERRVVPGVEQFLAAGAGGRDEGIRGGGGPEVYLLDPAGSSAGFGPSPPRWGSRSCSSTSAWSTLPSTHRHRSRGRDQRAAVDRERLHGRVRRADPDRGAIAVDRQMRVGLPGIYAARECIITHHRLLGETFLPLGTIAYEQGRAPGERPRRAPGVRRQPWHQVSSGSRSPPPSSTS